MKNSHIGCIVVFVVAALLFAFFSIPKLGRIEAQRTAERQRKDSASLERAWMIADSVHRETLMEDKYYVELYEEVRDLKERLERIRAYADDAEESVYYFESKGFDVSELHSIIDDIQSECE